jgi:peptidoglycan/LPS O-acetylase OafA/YrhL
MRLEVLRALVSFLVICTHWGFPPVLSKVGWVGVDLFFVLSGFLISGLLFVEINKDGRIGWGRFFVRRGFKIFPPFYVFLVATILLEWWLSDRLIRPRELLAECFFFQNYFKDYRFWGHTWSLAVEEHFYLLLPPCLMLMLYVRRGRREPLYPLPLFIVALALVILLGRSYSASRGFWVYSHTLTRMGALACGVALS